MNRTVRWGFVLALMPLAACASNPPPAPAPVVAAPPPPPPALAANDASFVTTAAQGGMAEVQMAELAEKNARSKAVKGFAEHMLKDHSANNDQLKQLVTSKNAELPTTLSDDQQKTMAMLEDEKGRKFDHDYMAAQIEGHTEMLSAMQTEASSGTDPDLKAFAAQTEPVVQQHLDMAKSVAGSGHKMMHHHPKPDAS